MPDLHQQLKARLLALPPRAFELFAGDLLGFIGLQDVAVTRYTGDGGIDATGSLQDSAALLSIPIGVQVKRYRSNVGRADIDRFIGALSGRYAQGIFITTAGYAPQAAHKAASSIPRVATINGSQVTTLMLYHELGVAQQAGVLALDEAYFAAFEAQASRRTQLREEPAVYQVGTGLAGQPARPEDDLISLRGLSHTLRVDTSTIRDWIEQGKLQPDQVGIGGRPGYLFRRDRLPAIRTALLGQAAPISPDAWRRAFLDFAASRNLSKSYKPVLLKALLQTVNSRGQAHLTDLATAFRAFYVARRQAGLPVEFGPPDPSDPQALSDAQLRQLIIRQPLERFLIQGFLAYLPEPGLVCFAPQLWHELRAWELIDLHQRADEQLSYYYRRPR